MAHQGGIRNSHPTGEACEGAALLRACSRGAESAGARNVGRRLVASSIMVTIMVTSLLALVSAGASDAVILPDLSPPRDYADFDGDGQSDLAVGAPGERSGGANEAGAVHVVYGAFGGGIQRGETWSEATAGVPGDPEIADRFGWALAAADFNNDGFSDLAVGAPYDDEVVGSIYNSGAITVLYGSPAGLSVLGAQRLTQGSNGVPGQAEPGDRFGWSLSAQSSRVSLLPLLAVGAPGERMGRSFDAGVVVVLRGSAYGVSGNGSQVLTGPKDSSGRVRAGDQFGFSLAGGDLDDDEFEDLVVGMPYHTTTRLHGGGAVRVFYGAVSGFAAEHARTWSLRDLAPRTRGINHNFGFSVAVGNFGRGGAVDVAISAPGNDNTGGVVHIVYGDAGRRWKTGIQHWSQRSPGVPDVPEDRDFWGGKLVAADFGRTSHDDLAIAAPTESVNGVRETGAVTVLYGSARGLRAQRAQMWSQASRGIAGTPHRLEFFGVSLVAADAGRSDKAELLIGVPSDNVRGVTNAGSVHVIFGSPRGLDAKHALWFTRTRASGGSAERDDGFGSLAGWR